MSAVRPPDGAPMGARHAEPGDVVERLACRAELASLPALLALVAAVCRREQLDTPTCHALRLITEEACVNVMRHAYPASQPGALLLEVRIGQQDGRRCLTLTLEDQGKPFDPLSVAPAAVTDSLAARVPGGLGVHLIRRLSEHQHYQWHPLRGNVFSIEKHLAPPVSP